MNFKTCIIATLLSLKSLKSSVEGSCSNTGTVISTFAIGLIANGRFGYSSLLLFFLLNPDFCTKLK